MTMHRDLAGRRFGRLVALRATELASRRGTVWECECDCGATCLVPSTSLASGNTRSCGCLQREAAARHIAEVRGRDYRDGTNPNLLRSKRRSDNTTGVKGVYFEERRGKFRAAITLKGRRRYLGYFESLEDARAARERAESELFKPILEGKATDD